MCKGDSTDHEGYTRGPPQLEERAVLRLVDENIRVKHQKVLLAAVVLRVLALVLLLLLRWLRVRALVLLLLLRLRRVLALVLLLVLLRRRRRRGSILLAVRLAVVRVLPVCMFLGRRVLLLVVLVLAVVLLALRVSVRGLPLVVLVLHPLLDVGWWRRRWARPHVLPLVLVLGR